MKAIILSSMPSAAIQLVYYAQTRGFQFSDVVLVGCSPPRSYIFEEYASINGFGLHYVEGENEPDCLDLMWRLQPDIVKIVTCTIIRKPLLEIPKIGVLNTHAAMLPRYRGVDTPQWAILEGAKVGVVEHFVDESIDTGSIIAMRHLEIHSGDTISKILYRNHYENKWQTATDALISIRDGKAVFCAQNPEDGRQYFAMHPKILKLVEEKLSKL
jgi:methionyl-tRNA formyltransferase